MDSENGEHIFLYAVSQKHIFHTIRVSPPVNYVKTLQCIAELCNAIITMLEGERNKSDISALKSYLSFKRMPKKNKIK